MLQLQRQRCQIGRPICLQPCCSRRRWRRKRRNIGWGQGAIICPRQVILPVGRPVIFLHDLHGCNGAGSGVNSSSEGFWGVADAGPPTTTVSCVNVWLGSVCAAIPGVACIDKVLGGCLIFGDLNTLGYHRARMPDALSRVYVNPRDVHLLKTRMYHLMAYSDVLQDPYIPQGHVVGGQCAGRSCGIWCEQTHCSSGAEAAYAWCCRCCCRTAAAGGILDMGALATEDQACHQSQISGLGYEHLFITALCYLPLPGGWD